MHFDVREVELGYIKLVPYRAVVLNTGQAEILLLLLKSVFL